MYSPFPTSPSVPDSSSVSSSAALSHFSSLGLSITMPDAHNHNHTHSTLPAVPSHRLPSYLSDPPINASRARFPFCLVWGPLPLISWILPFIGHLGLSDSKGRIHDFQGPIGIDQFMVGKPTKFIPIDESSWKAWLNEQESGGELTIEEVSKRWDNGLEGADRTFEQTSHNLFVNNCHHHSAAALKKIGFRRFSSQFAAWWYMIRYGRYVSWGALTSTYAPAAVIWAIIIMLIIISK
jgi:hypothetical protein